MINLYLTWLRLFIEGGVLFLLLFMLAGAGQAEALSSSGFDLTGNQMVNAADASMVADEWLVIAKEGGCMISSLADRDLDQSGCLDVGDVQMVLSHWGEPADPHPPVLPRRQVRGGTAATFVVNAASDESDSNLGDGVCGSANGQCTLRAALEESNVRAGRETVTFDIRNSDGSCPDLVTIEPSRTLVIDDVHFEGITLDGYTQCGASPNTQDALGNAQIKIEIKGSGTSNVHGLDVKSPGNIIRGLAIYHFAPQMHLSSAASHNRIEGNFLGTNADNTFLNPTRGAEGLHLRWGASYNIIGCGSYDDNNSYQACQTQAEFNAARNIVAGNSADAIGIQGDVTATRFIGNYVGLKQDGSTILRNRGDGIDFGNGPQQNWVGGTLSGERNVISGNGGDGVEFAHSSTTQSNMVVGNYIGLNASGTEAAPNGQNGVTVEDTVAATQIYNNVISGNGNNGIRLYILVPNSQIYNNLIGVAPNGITPMPNGTNSSSSRRQNGIFIMGGSQHNQIRNNVIAHHPLHGILLSTNSDAPGGFGGTFYNTISQNRIYNNAREGIELDGALDPSSGQRVFANRNLPSPEITNLTTNAIIGTTCPNCTVELFLADKNSTNDPSGDNNGEGKTFIHTTIANESGDFVASLACSIAPGQIVTATATDNAGNTSPFSRNVALNTQTQPNHHHNNPTSAHLAGTHRVYLPIVLQNIPCGTN